MKINRLTEIIVILLNKKLVTAKALAERFEVSTRTIYRDIETLSMSGVPVYMTKGKGGGISLIEEYSIDKTILSKEDKESLIIALQTLQATKYPEINSVVDKIGSIFGESNFANWIEIDFTEWGSNFNEDDKFTKIKNAILRRNTINFDYVNSFSSQTNRTVEPMKLMYKSKTWYLYGFCKLKDDFRIFRISRMKNLVVKEDLFSRKMIEEACLDDSKIIKEHIVTLRLRFKEKMLYRVFDDFNNDLITKNEDNTYDVIAEFPIGEWIYGYILSFGDSVEVLEPKFIRDNVINRLREMFNMYSL
ncbi:MULTISPECIES: helix-turn-helix transcriptional regulator [unclassified Clostridioides]|uniref:helix-turn-helix transcriptional regulator n=1 Tax=unclassified Clostridioides TaxID=2635829 RepID=UPI001D0FC639|nr:YafY family transcriptional regulator [Clostridioides sp. ZZV14-6150]MCC0661378.1 YafY family transcriptional regulator [Clostridioides sp. ZZV14-6154]MCC0663923.1 YafY family transcriptional regulator [Clostridioides sp. ZZV15-6597]MCC0723900.1 YafY family transcriptional regulator [Clostridioides sp. ZZV14-6104]MCC0740267.1 YafY family transcriptional regulator [Clostridioides sp. ZZV14-5902]MCC0744201.1 YafY family transcriptional regulator [Clostridioides sp. ZZV14-6044]MCC0752255.1 Ya